MSQDLTSRYTELVNERHKLDRWFNKYLDLFSEKMSCVDKSDPVWKLYDSKSKTYSEISKDIKTVEYLIKRDANV